MSRNVRWTDANGRSCGAGSDGAANCVPRCPVDGRDGTQFTARERALLEELRLHLVNVYRLVSRAEASQQQDAALADDGWSVVLVDDEGTVLQSNEVAVEIGKQADVDLGAGATLAGTALWSEVSGRVTKARSWGARSGEDRSSGPVRGSPSAFGSAGSPGLRRPPAAPRPRVP